MAENIDVVVRARDEASKTLNDVAGNVQKLTDRMTLAGGLIAGGVAAVATFKIIKKFADQASDAYLAQERVARNLTDAQLEFSSHLQDVLAVQDEHTNAAMRQAKALGIQEEQLESVTKAAIGLSEITGQSLSSAMFKVNEAINGNAGALVSYIPALRDAKTEQEKLALVSEFASKGLDRQLEKSRSIEGAIDRRNAAYQDLSAAIGELVKPSIKTQNTLAALATVAADSISGVVENWNRGGKIISQIMTGVQVTFAAGFAFIDTIADDFGKTWEIVTASFALSLETITQDFRHTFTEVLPKSAIWFAENFVNILRDGAVAAVTVIQNMGRNIGEGMFAIFEFIKGGLEGGIDGLKKELSEALFVGLMDGFEAHTQSLPEIIERQITGREEFLRGRVAELGGEMGGEFAKNFAERMDQINKVKAKFGDGFDFDSDINLAGADGAAGAGGGQQNRDLSAVESRLLTRGPREDRQDQMVRFLAKIAQNTQRLVDDPEEESRRAEKEGLQVEVVP